MRRSIEFDPAKDEVNVAKHGISLTRAGDGDWARAWIAIDDRRDYGEVRWYAYLVIEDRVHVVVFTERNGKTRIISLRRANLREMEKYDRLQSRC